MVEKLSEKKVFRIRVFYEDGSITEQKRFYKDIHYADRAVTRLLKGFFKQFSDSPIVLCEREEPSL